MRHFHRSTLSPDEVLSLADGYFPALELAPTGAAHYERGYAGALGKLSLSVRMEGGHYTFVEVHTDQVGESRLDKNVKKYFNLLHRTADPRHLIKTGY